MSKDRIYGDKQRTGAAKSRSQTKTPRSGKSVVRDTRSGQFTLGRGAFSKISEVEGIIVSRGLEADLRRLGKASPEKRRAALAQKYGKK